MMDRRHLLANTVFVCASAMTLGVGIYAWDELCRNLARSEKQADLDRKLRLSNLLFKDLAPLGGRIQAAVGAIPKRDIIEENDGMDHRYLNISRSRDRPSDDLSAISAIVGLHAVGKEVKEIGPKMSAIPKGAIVSAGSPYTNACAFRYLFSNKDDLFTLKYQSASIKLRYNFPGLNAALTGYDRILDGRMIRGYDRYIKNNNGEDFKSIIEGGLVKQTYLLLTRIPRPDNPECDVFLVCGSTGVATEAFQLVVDQIGEMEIRCIEDLLEDCKHFQIVFEVGDIGFDAAKGRNVARHIGIASDSGEAAVVQLRLKDQ